MCRLLYTKREDAVIQKNILELSNPNWKIAAVLLICVRITYNIKFRQISGKTVKVCQKVFCETLHKIKIILQVSFEGFMFHFKGSKFSKKRFFSKQLRGQQANTRCISVSKMQQKCNTNKTLGSVWHKITAARIWRCRDSCKVLVSSLSLQESVVNIADGWQGLST